MMSPAPTLTTTRLTLRGPKKSDLAPFMDFIVASPRLKALGLGAVAKLDYHHDGEDAAIYRHLPFDHADVRAQVAA